MKHRTMQLPYSLVQICYWVTVGLMCRCTSACFQARNLTNGFIGLILGGSQRQSA